MMCIEWIDPAGNKVEAINGNGLFRSNARVAMNDKTFYFSRVPSGPDPSGATVQAATGAWAECDPVDVTGAVATLALASDSAQNAIPKQVYPAGQIFLRVSGYVAPFRAAVI